MLVINTEIGFSSKPAYRINDTTGIITITGKIIDAETKKPIMYTSVFLNETSIGTVANTNGEFILKIPANKNAKIGFLHLGYKSVYIDISELQKNENIISMMPEIVSLQEIIVRIENPVNLLKGAVNNIYKNYSRKPATVMGFYRETIQQNKRYVSVAEAVLEAYKASYTSFLDDKVKILIGRKGQDVKKMDTLIVKLQGGPLTPFYLDIAKNPENLISEDFFKNYDLKLVGQTSLDNQRCYIVEFEMKKDLNLPLYKGKFFIDVDNLAFVAIEFGISDYGLQYANNLFIKKKPLSLKVEILGANYFIKYNKSNSIWNLAYVRSELKFKCKWKKRLFSSTYNITTEMAITDIDYNNVERIKAAEAFKFSDVFSEKADDFKNDDFWGDYNIIAPDESIMNAIIRLNKKLKRQQ